MSCFWMINLHRNVFGKKTLIPSDPKVCWEKVDFTRKSLGNLSPRTCHVCLRRRKGGEAFGDDVSLALRRELALCLQEQHGWVAHVKRSKADLELHVLFLGNL